MLLSILNAEVKVFDIFYIIAKDNLVQFNFINSV